MAAIRQLTNRYDRLQQQIGCCKSVIGKRLKPVWDYLHDAGIYNLDDVALDDLYKFRLFVQHYVGYNPSYARALDEVVLAYNMKRYDGLLNECARITKEDNIWHSVFLFLSVKKITDGSQITYCVREEYEAFIHKTKFSKYREYIKALDIIKLESIKRIPQIVVDNKEPDYKNEKVFLLYYSDYDVAKNFYYVQDKTELVFDFSLEASVKMKKQIFRMLVDSVTKEQNNKNPNKNRRERLIVPLKKLYIFCVENGIDDIEQLDDDDIEAFSKSMEGNVGTKVDDYIQIVHNIRRFLFLSSTHINWDANLWFLERMKIDDARLNPAREVITINMGQIRHLKNRDFLKKYIKYKIGISVNSLQTVRGQYYAVVSFLKWLDQKSKDVTDVVKSDIEEYFKIQKDKGIAVATVNDYIAAVENLFEWMFANEYINRIPICFAALYQKEWIKHKERYVPQETVIEILKSMSGIPMEIRLIQLHLCDQPARLCEICALKGDAYRYDEKTDTAWMRVYQPKMKKEKDVPISTALYEIMKKYIKDKNIASKEYIFKNKYGKAFDAWRFTKVMSDLVKSMGIDYDYKSHDFRHTVITDIYYDASIDICRQYAGHDSIEMTKMYVDCWNKLVKEKTEEAFANSQRTKLEFNLKGNEKNE